MLDRKVSRRIIVIIPFFVSLLLLFVLFVATIPSQANQLSNSVDRNPQTPFKHWVNECVDCDKRIIDMSNQSMKLDADGFPHIAYGGDSLYYAWSDGSTWHYETVDDAPGVGGNAALALDQNGLPHIVYYDRVTHTVKYAFRSLDGWQVEYIDPGEGYAGLYASIAIDQNNLPHLTYYNVTRGLLQYATFDGTIWHVQEIDGRGIYSHLVLDASDTPHVSYHDADSGVLKYAYLGESDWITETVDSSIDADSFTALVLDEAGYAHIGYYDEISATLKYAFQDTNGWNLVDLGAGSDVGRYAALELGSDGSPWMSYYDAANGDLKVGHWQASTWISSTVDSAGNVGGYTALEIDEAGTPYVSYGELYCDPYQCSVTMLKMAQQNSADWLVQVVDQSSRTGGFSSLGIDSAGTLHIGYLAAQGDKLGLRYAVQSNGDWLITRFTDTGELGGTSAPAMVLDSQGKPRFSYTFATCTDTGCTAAGLMYAELDLTGLITYTVDAGTGSGMYSSIAVDAQDYPHITYVDGNNLLLKYAYMDGTGWHTETITSTSLTTITNDTHMALDGLGYPHIVYNQSGLRYVYKDQDGWHFSIVEDGFDVRSSSVALDASGLAHIAYQDILSETLRYAYEDQDSWITETITGTLTDGFISLKLNSDDVPYISYHGRPDGDLRLAYLGSDGWILENVDSSGDVGKYTSLALADNGSIYISYYDATNSDLKLASYIELDVMFIPCVFK